VGNEPIDADGNPGRKFRDSPPGFALGQKIAARLDDQELHRNAGPLGNERKPGFYGIDGDAGVGAGALGKSKSVEPPAIFCAISLIRSNPESPEA